MKKKKVEAKSLGARLKRAKTKKRPKGPLWKGPEEDGVTQSLLNRFLICRERFRILVVEGLRPVDSFNHRLEYGQMWHVCEEAYTEGREIRRGQRTTAKKEGRGPSISDGIPFTWKETLTNYAKKLCRKYPLQQEQVQHWYNVCKMQFPIYVEYQKRHQSKRQRISLLQEQTFAVPYRLPSGRVVTLRGKWDGVDLIGKGRSAGVYLVEHKTKGDIKEEQIKRQLQFDLQTMFYLVALSSDMNSGKMKESKYLLCGVVYNVVRRPLSGGKGSIVRKVSDTNPGDWTEYVGSRGGRGWKNVQTGKISRCEKNPGVSETLEEFYERVAEYIHEEPEMYFMSWKVEVSQADVERFKREFLDPVLEQLCDWWGWVSNNNDLYGMNMDDGRIVHWRTPYGIYNVLAEGGATELDEYIATGSDLGLERATTLFRELE